MSILDGFSVYSFSDGYPYVSLTNNGATFNKTVIVKLDYPEYVLLLFNDEEKKIAIQCCDADTPKAVRFYKKKNSGIISVRWNNKDLLNSIQNMMGWDLDKGGYKADGIHIHDQNAIIFDLSKATRL
ncbi:MAG: hypothetical protein VB087_10820 [Candidatus Limiplasma sp.]|nr:hypothetical protein [Candidatus Limiplasma sp.]